MAIGLVGEKVLSGNAVQGMIPFEWLDEQFDPCPVVGEAPEVERVQGRFVTRT